MTDQLTAVLDRFVSDQRPAVPPIADVRTRARQRRRRRRSSISAAAAVAVLLSGAGLWAIQATREPGILVVADGEVRLNDWVTLTWLPDDVLDVRFDGTNREDAMETFGYWQGHFSLRRGTADPIVLHIALNDPFDVEAEQASHTGSVVEGDRVRFDVGAGRQSIYTAIGPATVQVIGDDPGVLHRLLDGMVVDDPTIEIPGRPVTLASGEIDGLPWRVLVTTPDTLISPGNVGSNGTCLVLRLYTAAGCVQLREDDEYVTTSWLAPPWEQADTVGPGWFLATRTDAVAFEFTRPDGTSTRVDARSATPAPGVFAVVDAGERGHLTDVRAIAADGTVLQEGLPHTEPVP